MGCGRCVFYLDTLENREVAGEAAIPFRKSPHDLAEKMQRVLASPALREPYQERALERVRERYDWDQVTLEYERLFERLLRKNRQSQPTLDPARWRDKRDAA